MALSFVNVATNNNTSGSTSTIACNVPASTADGDQMLLVVCHSVNRTISSGLEAWALVVEQGGTDGVHVYKRTAASEPASYTVTFSAGTQSSIGIISWNSTTAEDIVVDVVSTVQSNGDSTTVQWPAVVTTRSNAQVHFFMVGDFGLSDVVPDGGETQRWDITGTGHHNFMMSAAQASAGSSGTHTATVTGVGAANRTITLAIAEDTPSGPDGAPTDLTATAFDDDRIDLEWTDNASNEDGYSIERSPNGTDSWAEIDTVAANETTYSDTGLTEYTNYWYRVRAFTTGPTYSDYSNTANAKTLLAAPSGLTATAISDVQIDLEWTINSAVPPDFTAIERSPNGSTGWTEIATVAHPAAAYSNSQLNPQTTYWYRVRSARTP